MATKKKSFTKFQCANCKQINYFIRKSKPMAEKKLELQKFCKGCRKRTTHKEAKK